MAFVCLLFGSTYTFSQLSNQFFDRTYSFAKLEKKDKIENSLKDEFWGIQFGIHSNFTLSDFDGAAISVKRNFSKRISVRLGVSGNYRNEKNESTGEIDYQDHSFGLEIVGLYYINPTEKFNVYGYLGGKYSNEFQFRQLNYEFKDMGGGPLIGVGAEYFIYKRFSVFAEYSYIFKFGSIKRAGPGFSEDLNYVDFRSEYVKFGASVYFKLF